MLINEVLCFLIHRIQGNAADNIKRVLLNFYNADEIITAKKALWDIVSTDHIGEYHDRRTNDRRPAIVEHVNDLMKALNDLDSLNLVPEVAAKDLDRIPSRLPEELNTLMMIQRIADLEKCRDEHNGILTNMLIDVLNLQDGTRPVNAVSDMSRNINNNATNNTVIPQILVTPPTDITGENVQPDHESANNDAVTAANNNTTNTGNTDIAATATDNTNNNTNAASNNGSTNNAGGHGTSGSAPTQIAGSRWGPRPNPNAQRPPHASGGQSNMSHGGQRGSSHGRFRGRSNSSSYRGGQRRPSHDGGQNRPSQHGVLRGPSYHGGNQGGGGGGGIMGPPPKRDPYQWDTAMSRNKRRKITNGNGAPMGSLSGAPIPIRQIWVSRVHRGDIKEHMQINHVQVHNIEKTSHPESMFSSFKITIPVSECAKIFDESFWPAGVRCQWWHDKSHRNNDSDNDSTYDQSDNYSDNNGFNNNYYGSQLPQNNLFS